MKTIIKNGTIITDKNEYQADVLIEEGKIRRIGVGLDSGGAREIEASGKYLLPGGVDQHVHFSFEFNGTKVRGFESSAAAALGGTTTVIEFVNQKKDRGLLESIDRYREEQVEGLAAVDYSFHCVLTDPREEVFEEIPRLAEEGYPTMKLFMAYKGMFFHSDDEAILKALIKAREAGITLMVHAENADAIDYFQRRLIAENKTEPRYHATSRPPLVEAEATRRAIYLAQMADAPIYIVHVSCQEALEEIRRARLDGVAVRGETCTHYLTLDESNLAKADFEGAKYVCSPALRPAEHFEALWRGLAEGWLNAVSSDHCGFDWKTQKHMGASDFRLIPNGAPGLQNRLEVLWSQGVTAGKISRQELVSLFSANPARNCGLAHRKGALDVGYDADIVILDPDYRGLISNSDSLHLVDYCPYEGMGKTCRIEKVFLRGQLVVDEARYVGAAGQGQLVRRTPYALMYNRG